MADVEIKMVLTGAYAGETRILGGRVFRNGRTTLRGDALNLSHAVRYLARAYQAFPEGSDELKRAQERDRARGDADTVSEATGHPGAEEVQRGTEPAGSQSPEAGPAADGGSSDDPEQAGSVSTGDVSEGRGQSDAGNDSEPAGIDPTDPMVKAVMKLDPAKDEHWTSQGKPAMAAIESAYGSADITRADVDKVLPDWDRPKAVEFAKARAENEASVSELM